MTLALQEVRARLECPPSLRPLAPEAVVVQDKRGRRPQVSAAGLLLVAHHRYQLRVIPPRCLPDDRIEHVSLSPDEHVRPVGAALEQPHGDGRKEYTLNFNSGPLVRPFPVRTHVSVVIKHSRWGDYCHEVPVVIWPSMLNRFCWAFSAVVPMVLPFLGQHFLAGGHLRPIGDILRDLSASTDVLLLSAIGIIGVGLLVYIGNWGWQLFMSQDSA